MDLRRNWWLWLLLLGGIVVPPLELTPAAAYHHPAAVAGGVFIRLLLPSPGRLGRLRGPSQIGSSQSNVRQSLRRLGRVTISRQLLQACPGRTRRDRQITEIPSRSSRLGGSIPAESAGNLDLEKALPSRKLPLDFLDHLFYAIHMGERILNSANSRCAQYLSPKSPKGVACLRLPLISQWLMRPSRS